MNAHSITAELTGLLQRPVNDAARVRAVAHVLDWLGCAYAGTQTPEGRRLLAWSENFGSSGKFAVLTRPTGDRESAVFVNGGLGNILEMDDLHRTAILHPGPVVIPAALAAAQASNASGPQFLDAIVRGYEAMIRIGQSFGPGHYKHWHNTATAGPFGAAAAACSVLGADDDAIVHALGHAGTQSAGLWQTRLENSMSKQLHTGRAAHSGLIAAELAVSGFTAPAQILEGPQGFYAAMCPDPLPELVLAQSYDDWQIHEVSFKPWPACRHAHAAIDAALLLRDQCEAGEFGAIDVIESIEVLTYDEAVRFCDRPDPATVNEARFSLQHAVAVCLVRGQPTLADFESAAFNDKQVRAVANKVHVSVDSAINSRFPHRYGASLLVSFGGHKPDVKPDHRPAARQVRIDSPHALGDPDKPVSDEQRLAKAHSLMQWGGLSQGEAQTIASLVSNLPGEPDIHAFTRALAVFGLRAVEN
ncbi:MAG: MmgE/PrpD family protein [Burkholderiaceae bacterium]